MADNKTLIYIIDDDPAQCQMLTDHLNESFDFEIKTYATGEESVNELENHPDIIILVYFLDSVNSSARNGIEILKFIKKEYPDIKVIMMSSQDKIDIAVDCMKYGAFDYVIKNESGFMRIESAINRAFDYDRLIQRVKYYRGMSIFMVVAVVAIIIVTIILSAMGII